MNEENKIRTYKGFDKDLKCREFQYEIGKEYTHNGPVEACVSGFHACEQPIDVFSYYAPANSRYCETEQSGEMSRKGDDSKIASEKIKIGAEIGIPGIVKAQIEYVKAHTTTEHTDPKIATAGKCGAATSRGCSSVGENGVALARGHKAKVKGGLGSILVICNEKETSYQIQEWIAFVVDGKKIKPDTWYQLINGKIKEAEGEKQ